MLLVCRLYIKQPSSTTSISGDDNETEWAEYKIKETNMFTVDKYQQVRFSPNAGTLECIQLSFLFFFCCDPVVSLKHPSQLVCR